MQQSSLSFPSYANDCMVFFVSLWLRQEDTCARCEKTKVNFVFLARLFVSLW